MGQYAKLAAAIRAGAQLRPQCFGNMYEIVPGTGGVGSCAIGAAIEAIEGGIVTFTAVGSAIFRHAFVDATDDYLPCPADITPSVKTALYPRYTAIIESGGGRVMAVLEFLNDYLHWTRELIADYVEDNG